jgi:uncharacterized protein YqhQ
LPKETCVPEPIPSYGGQALIEGVLMRGRHVCAIAVRAPDQLIHVHTEALAGARRDWFARTPFLRGLQILWDALALGVRGLTHSARIQAADDDPLDDRSMAISLIVSLTIGVAFFFLLPAGIAYAAEAGLGMSPWFTGFFEGIIRLALLIGYIAAIGKIPEIARVYGYHGAEHMTINAYEAGAPLEVDAISAFPREHARCGTAFLLTVAVLSILLFGVLGPLPLLTRLLSRIILIPLVASLAYELIRLTSRHPAAWWSRLLLAPNLALQALTTRRPEKGMIEVALTAFQTLRDAEAATVSSTSSSA